MRVSLDLLRRETLEGARRAKGFSRATKLFPHGHEKGVIFVKERGVRR